MGSEDEVEQSFGRPCRQLNGRSKRTCELTSSVVPRGTCFPPLGGTRVSSCRNLSDMILQGCHAAAAACSRVQRNSVPSTQMRCMITANRRASATIAFFIPQRPCEVNRRPDASGGGLQLLARALCRARQISRRSYRAHPYREQHPVPEIRGLRRAVSVDRADDAARTMRRAYRSLIKINQSISKVKCGPEIVKPNCRGHNASIIDRRQSIR